MTQEETRSLVQTQGLAELNPLTALLFNLFLNCWQGECSLQRKRDDQVQRTLMKNHNTNGHLRRP